MVNSEILSLLILPGLFGATTVERQAVIPGVVAVVRPVSTHVPIGHPLWVHFSLENTTDKAVTLAVPGVEPEIPPAEMGLPLSHVFSGGQNAGVTVSTESGRRWELPVGYRSSPQAPILLLAPHCIVGARIDLRDFFPSVRGAGTYRVVWKPYAGALSSEPSTITVAPLKQVEMVTDDGTLTFRLFHDDAPETVANFLELAKSGFYTGKTFHRVEPGYMIQGGCPRGDGTGIRADGKRVRAELNSRTHEKGSVSMALLEDDPDSASCQFFICNTRQRDWDGKYAVFAELVGAESMATLDRLMSTPVDEAGRPTRTLTMRAVKITDAPLEAIP
jgi:cyclophilin family peptidyl-prolyl cis-trans isomerase